MRPRTTIGVVATASILAGACSAPAATPRGPVFTSNFYAYSVRLPEGWTATPAADRWDGSGAPGSGDSTVDLFESGGAASAFGSAAPTSNGLQDFAAKGIDDNAKFHADTCPAKAETVEAISIGGEPGTFAAWNCGILINVAFAVHAGKGYRFVFRDPGVQAATDPTDKATFTSILASVAFK